MCDELKNRDAHLLVVKKELKKQFIGIDDVIDKFISAVRVWYLMPELMTRPVIVNLWGLTGTGKTSLVRTFVRLIQMSDSFIEIQMDGGADNHSKQIRNYIDKSDIFPHQSSILLLDEIQRFRTIDDGGRELLEKGCFQDVWMLLSDGKFQSSSEKKAEIMAHINCDMYDGEYVRLNPPSSGEKKSKYSMTSYRACELRNLVGSVEPIEEIMKWSQEKKLKALKEALKDDRTFEGRAYSKMLIFISGNIDEAYHMSQDVNDADTDADIFHEFSKKINIINIKNALSKRFKPEQIARFGNNHIIYPSLSKSAYQQIIKQNISTFCDNVRDAHKIDLVLDDSVYRTIYENGVFPAQGVRPVISTISCIFENYVPIFLLKALQEQATTITIRYTDSNIIGKISDTQEISVPVDLMINKIKRDKNLSERTLTSVHEAGHAVVYSVLCKVTPTQIRSSTSDTAKEGFIGVHMMTLSKNFALDTIIVALAGQAAEEIVFGEEYKSAGASSDIGYATRMAASYVRTYAFDSIQSKVGHNVQQGADGMNTDIDKTNKVIEELLLAGKKKALDIINTNISYFKDLSQQLIDKGEVSPVELKEIASKYGLSLLNCSPEVKLIHNYDEKWYNYVGKQ